MHSGSRDAAATVVVVCPSISFPAAELRKITGIGHYEERLLYMLLTLADPGRRMVYLTSAAIDEDIIDYYLGFVPDEVRARERLTLVALDDPEPRALAAKLLERPDVVARVVEIVGGDQGAYVLPFNVTSWEAAFAEAVGLPLFGARPDLSPLGSKSGARRLARDAGVDVLDGAEDLWSVEEVEAAVGELFRRRSDAEAVVIKLNNGFSGQGNAILERRALRSRLEDSTTSFCAVEESWPSFRRKIASGGAVIEELVRVPGTRSPSAQLSVSGNGSVESVSTHDQILGGPDDQVYLGCRFPARADYRRLVQDRGLRIGEALASRGVIGPFGVDFLVLPTSSACRSYLSEINLRMGGTTHPFGMARLVTGGSYDARTGELVAGGRSKCYVATDNLKSETLAGMTPRMVIDGVRDAGLAFDERRRIGVTLHLLGALPRFGKMGVTCIEDTLESAEALYREVVAVVEGLAGGTRGAGA